MQPLDHLRIGALTFAAEARVSCLLSQKRLEKEGAPLAGRSSPRHPRPAPPTAGVARTAVEGEAQPKVRPISPCPSPHKPGGAAGGSPCGAAPPRARPVLPRLGGRAAEEGRGTAPPPGLGPQGGAAREPCESAEEIREEENGRGGPRCRPGPDPASGQPGLPSAPSPRPAGPAQPHSPTSWPRPYRRSAPPARPGGLAAAAALGPPWPLPWWLPGWALCAPRR